MVKHMRISTFAAAAALAASAWTASEAPPPFELDGSRIIVEHNATNGDAALIVEADTHTPLSMLELRNLDGAPMLRLQSRAGQLLGLGTFTVESADGDLPGLMARCPAGVYPMYAKLSNGRRAWGEALLSHEMPAAPQILWPTAGALVDGDALTLSWVAAPGAIEYRIGLEQGDTDTMIVRVAGGTESLIVPPGVLAPGQLSKVEVIAVGANGNRTAVEVEFAAQ